MHISELVAKLQQIQAEHGDLTVVSNAEYQPITIVEVDDLGEGKLCFVTDSY